MDKKKCDEILELYQSYYKKGKKEFRGMYMSDMEKIFNIPLLNDDEYNKAHKEVMELYLKFANWELE